jgi:hypothetical protein
MVQPEASKYAVLLCDFVASFVTSVNDEEEDGGLFRSVLKFLLKVSRTGQIRPSFSTVAV